MKSTRKVRRGIHAEDSSPMYQDILKSKYNGCIAIKEGVRVQRVGSRHCLNLQTLLIEKFEN